MARPKGDNRWTGPFRDRDGWRICVFRRGARATWHRIGPAASREDAKKVAEAYVRTNELLREEPTVRVAVAEYTTNKGKRGSLDTQAWESQALATLIDVCGDVLVGDVRPDHVEKFLSRLSGKMATRRSYYLAGVRFLRSLHRRGIISSDPVAAAEKRRAAKDEVLPWLTKSGVKSLGRGKPQLRGIGEVQRYLSVALAQEAYKDVPDWRKPTLAAEHRVATVLPLLTGASSGEIRHLRVGQVDFDGCKLRVRDDESDDGWSVKTASRRRTLELPDCLRQDLELLCKDRDPDDLVMPAYEHTDHHHKGLQQAHDRTWLRDLVVRVCARAKVRQVSPHGLRGTYASLMVELAGETAAKVGKLLGHADRGVTADRNYIGTRQAVPALRVVIGGKK